MSDAVDCGITVTEIAPMDQAIDVVPETTAAFIGRALRGPLNSPVLVQNFGEFRRRFGEVWSPSSLGPAVEHFFEHGGRRLYIVRVTNNARGAMVCLPASGSGLVLRALEPGSTECIRAAVDYDGIDDSAEEHFNLTLQRIDPVKGSIADQELFRRLSFVEGDKDFVADVLATSTLARVEHPYPTHRPDATVSGDSRYDLTWTGHAQTGTDGAELSDYDLIGSRPDKTGLFALEQCEHFDLLYMPPPGRCIEAGPAAVLAAELYCRERGAMLIVDPLRQWQTAECATRGVRDLGYASPNILGYFPRLKKRGNNNEPPQPAGGALAGLLCKLDRVYGPWQELNHDTLGFKSTLTPVIEVNDEDEYALLRAGINVIGKGTAGRARLNGSTTMSRGNESQRMFTSLPVQRLCLRIINSIDLATRWAVFEKMDTMLTRRISEQVSNYFASLCELGALANDRYLVQCEAEADDRNGAINADQSCNNGVTLLLVFQPEGCKSPVSFTLHQTVAGCRVSNTAFGPAAALSPAIPVL